MLWFDALIGNVDRSWRNPNLLVWHGDVWLIDHGASLYFHHAWASAAKLVARPYDADDHVLAPFVDDEASARPAVSSRRWSPRTCCARWWTSCPTRGWRTSRASTPPRTSAAAYVAHLLARAARPGGLAARGRPGTAGAASGAGGRTARPGWLG